MKNTVITPETLRFLKRLKKNNNRDWFNENKPEFKGYEANMKLFLNELMSKMNTHDEIEKMKMFRIYRDVRFSKNKEPYKISLSGSFSRNGTSLRGGYYVHIQPSNSFIATGFWQPNKEDLYRIRKELEHDSKEFRKVTSDESLINHWGSLMGEEVKTAPKGFDKAHENIDLIKKKQFIFTAEFSDAQVTSNDFLVQIDSSFKAIRPYFDLMSDILTTNLNGESILN